MNLHEVVTKLVGPITAVGETREDERRLENLQALTWLVEQLMADINVAARSASRQEASMKRIGTHAESFIREIGWLYQEQKS